MTFVFDLLLQHFCRLWHSVRSVLLSCSIGSFGVSNRPNYGTFFAARRYAYCSLCSHVVSVCLLSVCRSVTSLYCIETSKHILELFSPSGSPANLVFHTKRRGNIPTETTLTEVSSACVVWEKLRFSQISRFISEIIQDRTIVTVEWQQELLCNLSKGAISSNLDFKLVRLLNMK